MDTSLHVLRVYTFLYTDTALMFAFYHIIVCIGKLIY